MAVRDQRRGLRYRLKLSCHVSSPLKTFGEMDGVTENISRTGILVVCESGGRTQAVPTVGDVARVVVNLPKSHRFEPRCLDCLAKVVRVGPDIGPRYLAFEVRRMQFRHRPDKASAPGAPFPELAGAGYVH